MPISKLKIPFLLFIIIGFCSLKSAKPFSYFTKEELEAANTARLSTNLSKSEKEVIQIVNLFRLYPQKIAESIVAAYIKKYKKETSIYAQSLISDLKNATPCLALFPEDICIQSAKNHAVKMGLSGKTGHDDLLNRLSPHKSCGENCDYGHKKAIDIVMSLMIDEGIPNVGHRKNIMDKDFTHIGVAIKPHKTYRYNCVMDFVETTNSPKK